MATRTTTEIKTTPAEVILGAYLGAAVPAIERLAGLAEVTYSALEAAGPVGDRDLTATPMEHRFPYSGTVAEQIGATAPRAKAALALRAAEDRAEREAVLVERRARDEAEMARALAPRPDAGLVAGLRTVNVDRLETETVELLAKGDAIGAAARLEAMLAQGGSAGARARDLAGRVEDALDQTQPERAGVVRAVDLTRAAMAEVRALVARAAAIGAGLSGNVDGGTPAAIAEARTFLAQERS